MEQQNRWQDIREKMETELDMFSKEAAEGSKGLQEQLRVENRQRYDYRAFLRKFCVLKEEMQVDLDSFDYIFYHYGMELYGNMPLIEHYSIVKGCLDEDLRQEILIEILKSIARFKI